MEMIMRRGTSLCFISALLYKCSACSEWDTVRDGWGKVPYLYLQFPNYITKPFVSVISLAIVAITGVSAVSSVASDLRPRHKQMSSIEAHIEFEETTWADMHLRSYNGQYTLSATYLEDKRGDFEFHRKRINRKRITQQEYLKVWDALNSIKFWQIPSAHWPASKQQASQIDGIIHIKAVDHSHNHEVDQYVFRTIDYQSSHTKEKQAKQINTIARMLLSLLKRNEHTR
jgi:hypothetical protein